jgi:uncharacterized membrane protein YfcA
MIGAKFALLGALVVITLVFVARWIAVERRRSLPGPSRPSAAGIALGFVTNFFDTLGIGSFAPTTSAFKLWRMVPDERIPGTLNIGHAPPTVVQALIFITVVEMDVKTLAAMIAASIAGAWLGAGVVAAWPRRKVQVGMGAALLAAATFFTMKNLDLFPGGGDDLGISGLRLGLGVLGNFWLGALMTLGIGLYAPCMILVSLLGMNPKAAFPIMMGSCAFLMPVGSLRFIEKGSYSLGPALGLAIGGVPAVLIAALIVKELPLVAVRWLVVVVVVYTATAMLRSALAEKPAAVTEAARPAAEGP